MSADGIRRNAGFAFAAQMTGAALTAVLTIFLGARLSAHDYGLFAFAVGVATLWTLISDLGVSASASRFIAEHRGDRVAVRAVFTTALELKLVIGVVTSAALFLLAPVICDLFNSAGAVWPLRGVAVALLGQSTFLMIFGALDATGQIRYRLVIAAAESVVEAGSSIALVLVGAGATGAAFGRAIGYTTGLVLGVAVTARVIGLARHRAGAPRAVSRRRILGYAGPLLLIDAAFRVFGSIDVLLVAAFLGGGAHVAAFELPMRLVVFLDYAPGAVAAAVAPRLATRDRVVPDVALFARTMRYLILLQVLLLPPLLVWPEAIFHVLFGDKYAEAPDVLRALVPFVLLSGVAQLATLGVNYLGEAGRRVPFAVAMLAVNAGLDAVLLPRIGVVGAGIGTSAAYLVWVPAHLWILRERLGLELAPLLRTTARALLAAAVVCGLLALLGTGQVALWRMAVGALLAPWVYGAALLALREITRAELAPLLGRVRRRVA